MDPWSNLLDLAVNLVAAFIGYLIARGVARWRRRRRTAAGRRFWTSFPDTLRVVLPVWDREVDGWTSSEVFGPGDVRALLRLQAAMIEIDRGCEPIEASALGDDVGNLVLLGGGDANEWSARFLASHDEEMAFGFDADQTLRLKGSDIVFGDTPVDEHRSDAGLVVRAPGTPVGTGTKLLLAGVTGVGTDAAARLVSEDLAHLLGVIPDDGREALEVVFTVDVVRGRPLTPRIVAWRRFGDPKPTWVSDPP